MEAGRYYMVVDGLCCQKGRLYLNMLMRANPGVRSVGVNGTVACIETERKPNLSDWVRQVNESGLLHTSEKLISTKNPARLGFAEFAVILAVLLGLFLLLKYGFGIDPASLVPTPQAGMSLVAVFLVGLFGSVHCMCMCGAISLSSAFGASGSNDKGWKTAGLYNLGRVISYTAFGAIAGAVGSVFQLSRVVSAVLLGVFSVMMVGMALNMAGLISIPLFRCVARRAEHGRGAFAAGLLNVLMPCGALQSMQLYALSTQSALLGALSMGLFCLGTVPLMFGVGAAAASVGGTWRIRATKAAAVVVFLLALAMAGRAFTMMGLNAKTAVQSLADYPGYAVAQIDGGVQRVATDLGADGYGDILVYKEVPVVFTIHVGRGDLTGCNKALHMDAFHTGQVDLHEGDNVIEFTPHETGTFTYSCWMDMITNTVAVVDRKG